MIWIITKESLMLIYNVSCLMYARRLLFYCAINICMHSSTKDNSWKCTELAWARLHCPDAHTLVAQNFCYRVEFHRSIAYMSQNVPINTVYTCTVKHLLSSRAVNVISLCRHASTAMFVETIHWKLQLPLIFFRLTV